MSNSWMELSSNERYILAYTPKPAALISCIASTLVAIHIFRDKEKMGKMYHRLALGMCISGACNAFNFFLTSWAIPYENEGYVQPWGTVGTCTASGFMVQLGFVVQHYYVALSIYVFMALRCEFRIKEIEWIEKYLHVGVFIFPLLSAIYLYWKEMFNPIGVGCWINSYPQGCKSDQYGPCQRGPKDPVIYGIVFATLPMTCNLIVATLIIISCYVNEQMKYKRLLKSGRLKGKQVIFEHARRKKSMLIARQGARYLAIFYLSYTFLIIASIVQFTTSQLWFPTYLLAMIFLPTDGLFFTIAYIILLEKKDNSSTSNDQRASHRSIPDVDAPNKQSDFSIFGATEEEKWKLYGVYIGPDADRSDDSDRIDDSDRLDDYDKSYDFDL